MNTHSVRAVSNDLLQWMGDVITFASSSTASTTAATATHGTAEETTESAKASKWIATAPATAATEQVPKKISHIAYTTHLVHICVVFRRGGELTSATSAATSFFQTLETVGTEMSKSVGVRKVQSHELIDLTLGFIG